MATVIERKELNRKQELELVKALTITPQLTFNPVLKYKPYLKGKLEEPPFKFFITSPTTVTVPYAYGITLLDGFPHEDESFYNRIKLTFTGSLRERQQKKVRKLDEYLNKFRTVTFCAHTGFGKTRISTYYIAKFNLFTVVIVPSVLLLQQWPAAINAVVPSAKVRKVGEDYNENETDIDVLVCMPDRWSQIPAEVRSRIGLVIVDEAHMFCTPARCPILLQFEPKYVLALTASPRRRDSTFGVIQALSGLHQVRARYKNPVIVWRFETGITFDTKKNVRGATDWTSTLKSIATSEEANLLIAQIILYLVDVMKRKPILMCERKYQVTTLQKILKEAGVSSDVLLENKNEYNDSEVLISIMKKAGTGFDEEYACPDFGGTRIDTVLYATSFKEINGLIQYGGRAFRADKPLIVHLVHDNAIVKRHWSEAKKYYKSGEYLTNVSFEEKTIEDIK